jgi:hypothetical protein
MGFRAHSMVVDEALSYQLSAPESEILPDG